MPEKKTEINIENIKTQIDLLKQSLENIGKTLDLQENTLNILHEDRKTILCEVLAKNTSGNSIEEIMKNALSKGKIPKILKQSF